MDIMISFYAYGHGQFLQIWSHNYVNCKFVFDSDDLFDTDQIINAAG